MSTKPKKPVTVKQSKPAKQIVNRPDWSDWVDFKRLNERVEELERKVAQLEVRPFINYYPVPPQPYPAPLPENPRPGHIPPYFGDPLSPRLTCAAPGLVGAPHHT